MKFVEYNGKKYEVIDNKLDLSGLGIEKIEDIKGLDNLKLFALSLNNNQIKKISGLKNQTHLYSLNLSNNQISKIENLDNLVNLQVLRLQNNKIEKLEGIENLLSLKYIYLENNPFTNDFKGYYLTHEDNDAAKKIEYVRQKIGSQTDHIAKRLLTQEECEYLDFKIEMYQILDTDKTLRLESRKEFLKDILGLINNFKEDKSLGISYLLFGVAETNGKYNGHHHKIEFNDIKILKDLINANLSPELINIDLEEFFISGDDKKILILKDKRYRYDRNIILKIRYDPGIDYEFKKEYGNPHLGVPYYTKGTSFYRDGSHTRPMTREIREKIRNLLPKFEIPNKQLKDSLLRCYQAIEELCDFQSQNVRYQDIINRSKIERILMLLKKYKEELAEYLSLYFNVKSDDRYSMDVISEYRITLNELEIIIFMRVDYIADIFMYLEGNLVLDQTEIKPFLIKLKKKIE